MGLAATSTRIRDAAKIASATWMRRVENFMLEAIDFKCEPHVSV